MKRATFTHEEGPVITSVEHFLAEVKRFAGKGDYRLCFRGHGQPSKTLVPSIGRKHRYAGKFLVFSHAQERRLLFEFRRHAYEHFGRVPSEWETLFLARHHGLPTRLLDWTSNPLVALYFAAFYQSDEIVPSGEGRPHQTAKLDVDGTVWAFQRRDGIAELDPFTETRSPLEVPGIKLVYPFNPTRRMTAQSGMFTLHGDPWTDMVAKADSPFPAADLDLCKLITWRVESRSKTDIVLDLERLAINSRTLFPDLEGLAHGLWQTELIRECFKQE